MTKQPNFAPWSTAWTIFQFYILSKPPSCKMSVRFIHDSLSGDRPAPEGSTAHNMRPSSVGKGVATIVGGGGGQDPVKAQEAEVDLKNELKTLEGPIESPGNSREFEK